MSAGPGFGGITKQAHSTEQMTEVVICRVAKRLELLAGAERGWDLRKSSDPHNRQLSTPRTPTQLSSHFAQQLRVALIGLLCSSWPQFQLT